MRTKISNLRTVVEVELPGGQIDQHSDAEKGDYSEETPGPEWVALAHRQGHSHTHDEQERRKNEICWSDPIPFCVIEEPIWMRRVIN